MNTTHSNTHDVCADLANETGRTRLVIVTSPYGFAEDNTYDGEFNLVERVMDFALSGRNLKEGDSVLFVPKSDVTYDAMLQYAYDFEAHWQHWVDCRPGVAVTIEFYQDGWDGEPILHEFGSGPEHFRINVVARDFSWRLSPEGRLEQALLHFGFTLPPDFFGDNGDPRWYVGLTSNHYDQIVVIEDGCNDPHQFDVDLIEGDPELVHAVSVGHAPKPLIDLEDPELQRLLDEEDLIAQQRRASGTSDPASDSMLPSWRE